MKLNRIVLMFLMGFSLNSFADVVGITPCNTLMQNNADSEMTTTCAYTVDPRTGNLRNRVVNLDAYIADFNMWGVKKGTGQPVWDAAALPGTVCGLTVVVLLNGSVYSNQNKVACNEVKPALTGFKGGCLFKKNPLGLAPGETWYRDDWDVIDEVSLYSPSAGITYETHKLQCIKL